MLHSLLCTDFRLYMLTLSQRPDLAPPAFDVPIQDMDYVEPGYIFITPYQTLEAGPYIYDKLGVSPPRLSYSFDQCG